ncbi:hypothetical protein S40288_02416 [Stachybotrys chartarum IBT 40288]|nr:hypothetical protein S40288_02416 [Stachybotrys chartarum IBT 40288]
MANPYAHGWSPANPIDLTNDAAPRPSQKRTRGAALVSAAADGSPKRSPKRKKTKSEAKPEEEKRLRVFRSHAPQTFYGVYERALSQRFYVLKRQRIGTDECPEELVEMTGSTGNVYEVHVARQPSCTCPHALKGNQCKHILWVLSQVLNAPFELVYQLALLSSELRAIFAAAPPIIVPEEVEHRNRKEIEGDCPICFSELDAESPDSIVWCRAACGQNFHSECFRIWARTKGGNVPCPLCRSQWQRDEKDLSQVLVDGGAATEEGYVNVAEQLGISRVRGLCRLVCVFRENSSVDDQ